MSCNQIPRGDGRIGKEGEKVNAIWGFVEVVVGTVVGAIGSYLATRAVEVQRWQQQKRDRLQLDKREALRQVMDWLNPIDLAVLSVSVYGAQPSESLLTQIAQMDLRPSAVELLPPGVYGEAGKILTALEHAEAMARYLRDEQYKVADDHVEHPNEPNRERLDALNRHREDFITEWVALQAAASQYRKRLGEEFRATYE